MRKFTEEEDQFLRQNYKKIPAKRMATMLGRAESCARQRMKLLGIVVPAEIIVKFKKESQFKKGHEPSNKGKKWNEFMSKEGMRNSRKTTFKKGQPTHNKRPLGSERVDADGYVWMKISEPNKWMEKHRIVWKEHYGSLPKNINIQFKDGNRQNCSIENLYAISRKEQMKQNSIHSMPKEVALVVQMMGALKRQINKRTNARH